LNAPGSCVFQESRNNFVYSSCRKYIPLKKRKTEYVIAHDYSFAGGKEPCPTKDQTF
jgi:hypothetical protein